MSTAFAEATATTAGSSSISTIIIAIVSYAIFFGLIIFFIRKRKKKKQAKIDAVQNQAQEAVKLQNEIEGKIKASGFTISSAAYCDDKMVHRPKKGNMLGEYIIFNTKAFYIDKVNRKVAFAWIETPPIIRYMNFDDIISCEIIYNGIKETTHTYVGTNVGNTHMGNVVSGGSEYVNQLGIKVSLRDPSNPTFVMPLITKKTFTVDPSYKKCIAFAQSVRDSMNAIVNM